MAGISTLFYSILLAPRRIWDWGREEGDPTSKSGTSPLGNSPFFPLLQLHIAGANGYLRAAELLLDHGVRVDVKDWDGWEPLHAAAFWGQMQMAELLVSHGASLSARTSMDEMPIGKSSITHGTHIEHASISRWVER